MESNWGREEVYAELDFTALAGIAELDQSDNHLRDTEVRAELLIEQIAASPDETIVIFAHWGIYSQLFKSFFDITGDIETRAIHQNTAVSKLIITDEGIRQLEYWNDHAHVPGI